MVTIILLFFAGFLGGAINTLAGGGSFVIFPALLASGVPAVLANASNTFACFPGYASGALGYRNKLAGHRGKLLYYLGIGLLGGYFGAELLLRVSNDQFRLIIPWLMAFAVITYVLGGTLSRGLARATGGQSGVARARVAGLALVLLALCLYGGFFNAGLGIILLAYLALEGHEDVHVMNGLKLLVATVVSLVAVVRFALDGKIAWAEGTMALLGAVTGAYLAARFSQKLPSRLIRGFVIVYGVGITAWFFYSTYGPAGT